MVLDSSPVAVTSPSDLAPASSKEFLDIQATIECRFTLKRVRDMIRTYSQLLVHLNIFWYRSSHPDVFLEKGVLKKCSKFTRGHPCRSAISIKFLENFVEMALRHGCSPVNLLHIFRIPFPNNTSGRLLLLILTTISFFNDYFHFFGLPFI